MNTPKHLSKHSAVFWDDITTSYRLDRDEIELLRLTCEAMDAAEAARLEIERDGATVQGLHGPRAHPAVAIRRDQMQIVVRFLKQLNLPPQTARLKSAPNRLGMHSAPDRTAAGGR